MSNDQRAIRLHQSAAGTVRVLRQAAGTCAASWPTRPWEPPTITPIASTTSVSAAGPTPRLPRLAGHGRRRPRPQQPGRRHAGWDKYTFHLYAEKFGFPAAAVLAQFRPTAQAGAASSPPPPAQPRRTSLPPGCASTNAGRFRQTLLQHAKRRLFHLVGYHPEDDTLALLDGGRIAVSTSVDRKVFGQSAGYFKREMGYLFQEVPAPIRPSSNWWAIRPFPGRGSSSSKI